MKIMEISAQLYTVRDYTQTADDLKETFKKLKKIGYESVQLSAMGPIKPEIIKELADENGLGICGTHTPFDRVVNETEAVINEHKIYGTKNIGIGGLTHEIWQAERSELKDFVDECKKQLTPAIKKISDAGMKFAYHNHAIDFQHIIPGVTLLDYLIDGFSSDSVGLVMDFYWSQLGGLSYTEVFEKYSDRLDIVHFKDLLPVKNTPMIAAVGDGNINYKKIYEECKKYGVKYIAVEQDDCYGENPFDCLERSYNTIKSFEK